MDFTKQGLTYILLIIPTAFAVTIIVQGIQKISRNNPDGKVAVGFGIFFLVLIAAAYILFIR